MRRMVSSTLGWDGLSLCLLQHPAAKMFNSSLQLGNRRSCRPDQRMWIISQILSPSLVQKGEKERVIGHKKNLCLPVSQIGRYLCTRGRQFGSLWKMFPVDVADLVFLPRGTRSPQSEEGAVWRGADLIQGHYMFLLFPSPFISSLPRQGSFFVVATVISIILRDNNLPDSSSPE